MISTRQYPISEIFGPTIQGEGAMAGIRTFFVRFAGCDWDCSWCDTQYAIHPGKPGWKKEMMTGEQIEDALVALGLADGDWITFSGGNPALFFDKELGQRFGVHYNTAMETQGSRMLLEDASPYVHLLTVSPKPPSSGMHTRNDPSTIRKLLQHQRFSMVANLKYVAFDDADLNWVAQFDRELQVSDDVPRYISAGTPTASMITVGVPGDNTINPIPDDAARLVVCERLKWLFEVVAKDYRFRNFIALPQLHVLAWGQKAGV